MAGPRSVLVQYFAILREESGVPEEQIWTHAGTATDLYEELQERHGFSLHKEQLKVVVNEEFSDWSHEITEGDAIVFIPPVAGG